MISRAAVESETKNAGARCEELGVFLEIEGEISRVVGGSKFSSVSLMACKVKTERGSSNYVFIVFVGCLWFFPNPYLQGADKA